MDKSLPNGILKKITQLKSKEPFERRDALEAISESGIKDDRIIKAIIPIAESDPNSIVRGIAKDHLYKLGYKDEEKISTSASSIDDGIEGITHKKINVADSFSDTDRILISIHKQQKEMIKILEKQSNILSGIQLSVGIVALAVICSVIIWLLF